MTNFSQGYLNSLIFSTSGKTAKFMLSTSREHISGSNSGTTAILCSAVIPKPPPVVGQITTLHFSLILVRVSFQIFRSAVELPSSGFLTWTWTTAAPALYALNASSASWSGVIGRYGVWHGATAEPVNAQVIMVLGLFAIFSNLLFLRSLKLSMPTAAHRVYAAGSK